MNPINSSLLPTTTTATIEALRLDVFGLAQSAGILSGDDPLPHYQRLASDLHASAADWPQLTLQWNVRGEMRSDASGAAAHWLHLKLRAQLPMTCQRCLGQVNMPVALDNSYRFVADEATAEREDEQCDEDLLVLSHQFDLRALLEDELLLELPLVPKHEVCPSEVKLASTDEDFKAALTQKPNAFAALGSLKKAL